MKTTGIRLWQRWREVARRAAAFQSRIVLWLLYYVLLVPIAMVAGKRPQGSVRPTWQQRPAETDPVTAARRQF